MKTNLTFVFVLFVCTLYAQHLEVEGDVDVKNYKINNLADPAAPQDAATKAYVDNMLLSFGLSMGSTGIQALLNAGYSPIDIINAGASKNSLYGKMYQGGLIFYLDDLDNIPGVIGFVCAPVDQNLGSAEWGCFGQDLPNVPNVDVQVLPFSGPGADIGDGVTNTAEILNDCPTATAALACTGYIGGGFSDWFLPSVKELNEMYFRIGPVAPAPNTNIGGFAGESYWSSSEVDHAMALTHSFLNATQSIYNKGGFPFRVRAVRAF